MPANLWPGDPLVVRKATLASLPTKAAVGIRFNEHNGTRDGGVVFYHACKLGLEGIVSKRKELDLSLRPLTGLAQDEEPCVRGGAARGRRGLGPMKISPAGLSSNTPVD